MARERVKTTVEKVAGTLKMGVKYEIYFFLGARVTSPADHKRRGGNVEKKRLPHRSGTPRLATKSEDKFENLQQTSGKCVRQ